jgi:hypothetical protein
MVLDSQARNPAATFNIYYVKSYSYLGSIGKAVSKIAIAYIKDYELTSNGGVMHTIAHELGHCFGLGHSNEAEFGIGINGKPYGKKHRPGNPAANLPGADSTKRWMHSWSQKSEPTQLIKEEWDYINEDDGEET